MWGLSDEQIAWPLRMIGSLAPVQRVSDFFHPRKGLARRAIQPLPAD